MLSRCPAFTSSFFGLPPKIPVPTLTMSLPVPSAASKSLDIPMLNNSPPSSPHLPFSAESASSSTSLLCLSFSKSSFGFSVEWRDSVMEPIVISPWRWRWGQDVMTCFASRTSSDSGGAGTEVRGASPDFASSPDVLTCRRTFSGVVRVLSCLFSASAPLAEPIVWTACRFGIAGYKSSTWKKVETRGTDSHIQARILALFVWNVPMKCQRMSAGSYGWLSGQTKSRDRELRTCLLCLVHELLHVVLAKVPLSIFITREDIGSRLVLRDGDKGRLRPSCARRVRGRLHASSDFGERCSELLGALKCRPWEGRCCRHTGEPYTGNAHANGVVGG